jgi:uncharacterized membrane protein
MTEFIYQHRSKLKIFTYSVMHMCVAIAVAYALSGSLMVALSIGIIEPIVQTFAYVVHEKGWGIFSENIGKSARQPWY